MKSKKHKRLLALGLGIALFLKYNENQCFNAKRKDVFINSSKIRSDIRITQISDFHSNVINNLDKMLDDIANFNPHFIILTGDMIDYATDKKIDRTMFFLDKLTSLGIKTFFITGNHEEASPRVNDFIEKLDDIDITYLNNQAYELVVGKNIINLYGTSFLSPNFDKYKPSKETINIILTHHSRVVRESKISDFDISFSGHTHGGQVRVPLLGALLAPGEGILPKYDMGLYDFNRSKMYIDSGLGNTFLPLRFLDPIGYSNITIENASVV